MNRTGRTLHGARILCLGAAFKAGVSDIRNSRAIRVMELLEEAHAHVEYADPHVPTLTLASGERKTFPLGDVTTAGFDLVVVLQAGSDWPLDELEAAGVPVFDAVNAGGREGGLRERL
jgi:UDP-N-acetyl-D-glucosamine dehydrogenase